MVAEIWDGEGRCREGKKRILRCAKEDGKKGKARSCMPRKGRPDPR